MTTNSPDEKLTMSDVIQRYYAGAPAKTTKRPNTDTERSAMMLRMVNKMALMTELGRMVRDCVKSPAERERCYWKLIEAMDYSDAWHDRAARGKLGNLLEELRAGYWKDIETDDGIAT